MQEKEEVGGLGKGKYGAGAGGGAILKQVLTH